MLRGLRLPLPVRGAVACAYFAHVTLGLHVFCFTRALLEVLRARTCGTRGFSGRFPERCAGWLERGGLSDSLPCHCLSRMRIGRLTSQQLSAGWRPAVAGGWALRITGPRKSDACSCLREPSARFEPSNKQSTGKKITALQYLKYAVVKHARPLNELKHGTFSHWSRCVSGLCHRARGWSVSPEIKLSQLSRFVIIAE